MEQPYENRPTGELLGELSEEARVWLRQEIALAKEEVSLHIARARRGAIAIAIGAFMALLGVMALVATFIIALAIALPWWLSATIIALLFLIVGGISAMIGIRRIKSADLVPHVAIGSVKEDLRWLKKQIA